MGYTHYYEDITLSEDIVDEVKKIVSAVGPGNRGWSWTGSSDIRGWDVSEGTDIGGWDGISDLVIRGEDGGGDPIINSEQIVLNGDASTGQAHATFVLQNGFEGSLFCKTARKPYDTVVVAILVSLIVNDGVRKVVTNGTPEDWLSGIRLYAGVVRKLEPSDLDAISDKVFDGNANFSGLV